MPVTVLFPHRHRVYGFGTRAVFGVCLLGCCVLLLAGYTPRAAGDARVTPFEGLMYTDGSQLERPLALDDGRWTLVMIWASDCHICKEQKPLISAFHDAHQGDRLARVVGVALDGRGGLGDVEQYLEQHPASFPNYVGEYAVVAVNYQMLTDEPLRGTPTYLLFDRQGKIMGINPGPITVAALEKFIARHENGNGDG